jgi:hypothetical protein
MPEASVVVAAHAPSTETRTVPHAVFAGVTGRWLLAELGRKIQGLILDVHVSASTAASAELRLCRERSGRSPSDQALR